MTGSSGYEPRWTTIKVRPEFRDYVKAIAKKLNAPMYVVLEAAMHFFVDQMRNPRLKENLPLIDKISWYIIKVSMSVGAFKENPSDENLSNLRHTCKQIEERLGVDTRWLIRAAENYKRKPSKATVLELNSALKQVVIELIKKLMSAENPTEGVGPLQYLEAAKAQEG